MADGIKRECTDSDAEWTNRWALLLAGGDGTRLRTLTRHLTGDDRPKQFCPVMGGATLLEETWQRAILAVPHEHAMVVVTQRHEVFYGPLLRATGIPHLVAQPENRGTGAGIFYPLLRLAALAPDASVVIFPSDHHFSDDRRLIDHVDSGFRAVAVDPARIILLGIVPDTHDAEYGWIEPGSPLGIAGSRAVYGVDQFWEKPEPVLAEILRGRGCLWNSFVMIGKVQSFLDLIEKTVPELHGAFAPLVRAMEGPEESRVARRVYSRLAPVDFSRDIVSARPAALGVIRVQGVSWSDLGSPERVFRILGSVDRPEPQLLRS
jgi:mannose-1-phosphate guanylyltransferase